MSLNWNIKDVADEFCWNEDDSMDPTMNQLIWGMMVIDMNGITEKNVDEVHRRFHVAAVVYEDPTYKFKLKELSDRIGLSTNVATTTKVQFKAKMFRALDRVASDNLRRERKE